MIIIAGEEEYDQCRVEIDLVRTTILTDHVNELSSFPFLRLDFYPLVKGCRNRCHRACRKLLFFVGPVDGGDDDGRFFRRKMY